MRRSGGGQVVVALDLRKLRPSDEHDRVRNNKSGHDKLRFLYTTSPTWTPRRPVPRIIAISLARRIVKQAQPRRQEPELLHDASGVFRSSIPWSSITRASLEMFRGPVALSLEAFALAFEKHDVNTHRKGYLPPENPCSLYTQCPYPSKHSRGTSSWLLS